MAEGNLNVKITVDMKNEIGGLAESFNKTSSVLIAYIDDIRAPFCKRRPQKGATQLPN